METVILSRRALTVKEMMNSDVIGVFPSHTAAAKYVAKEIDLGPKATQVLIDKWLEGLPSFTNLPPDRKNEEYTYTPCVGWEVKPVRVYDEEGNLDGKKTLVFQDTA